MQRKLRPDLEESYWNELGKSRGHAAGHGVSVFARQSRAATSPAVQAEFSAHPYWPEWTSLSPAVRAACRNDFRIFLDLRAAGMMSSLVELVAKDLERDAMASQREADRTAWEREIAAAGDPANQTRIIEESNARQNAFQREIAAANARSLSFLRR